MKKLLIPTISCVLLLSCGSPLDKKFNEKTFEEDAKTLKTELDSTEMMLLAGTMVRLKLKGENLEEMSYAEILQNGKRWRDKQLKLEAQQKKLVEMAAKKEAARIERLQKASMVTCFEKGFSEYDYQEFITYKFVIHNKSDKDIRAIKGEITFTDLFDQEIKSLSFVYDDPIAAGTNENWNASTDYNQFMDDDQALKNKDLEDMKVVWKPEKIIFADGSVLE